MKQRIICAIMFFQCAFIMNAQSFLQSYPSVTGLNLGRAEAIEDLGMSSLGSPALSLYSADWQVSTSFRQFSFGEYPLSHFQAGLKKRFQKTQHWGLQAQYTGNSAVGLMELSALYGRSLFENLNLGVQLNYGQRNIDLYETDHQLSLDIALSSEPIPGLHIGAWARHLLQIKGSSMENASLLVSGKYHITEDFRVYGSFYTTITSELIIGAGAYYRLIDQLDLKLGYYPTQNAFAIGFGLNFNEHWGVHTAGYMQPSFGSQPSIGAYYQSTNTSQ